MHLAKNLLISMSEPSADVFPRLTRCISKKSSLKLGFDFDQPSISNLQVLEEFPKTQINIDLKDQEERLVARVEEVVKAHRAENRLAKFGCTLKISSI